MTSTISSDWLDDYSEVGNPVYPTARKSLVSPDSYDDVNKTVYCLAANAPDRAARTSSTCQSPCSVFAVPAAPINV